MAGRKRKAIMLSTFLQKFTYKPEHELAFANFISLAIVYHLLF